MELAATKAGLETFGVYAGDSLKIEPSTFVALFIAGY